MPKGLTAAAQRAWPKIAEQLTEARILTKLDAQALATYCEMFARWRDACDKIETFGPVVKTGQGGLKLSPFWVAFVQSSAEMRRLLIEFGMTPAARARVEAIKGAADDDPFADF